MSSTSTLSEQIFGSLGTGKDPAVLDVLEGINSTLTAAELNILDGVTATAAQINAAAAPASRFVTVADATPYTVLAADSGKTHILPDFTSSTTLNLPVAVAGLEYTFISKAVAGDAQNWVIVATTPSYYKGGVFWSDDDNVADNSASVYGNGSSHLTFTAVAPLGGTMIYLICDGTNWIINGIVQAIATPTFA